MSNVTKVMPAQSEVVISRQLNVVLDISAQKLPLPRLQKKFARTTLKVPPLLTLTLVRLLLLMEQLAQSELSMLQPQIVTMCPRNRVFVLKVSTVLKVHWNLKLVLLASFQQTMELRITPDAKTAQRVSIALISMLVSNALLATSAQLRHPITRRHNSKLQLVTSQSWASPTK